MRPFPVRLGLALTLLAGAALAANVEEKYDDGKLKTKYSVDEKGRKEGLYQEFHATGKIKLRATYKQDALDVKYSLFYESGKTKSTATYKDGKLSGAYTEFNEKGQKTLAAVHKDGKFNGKLILYENGQPTLSQPFKDGEPVYPKSKDKIVETLKAIFGDAKPGGDDANQRDFALRRLKAYRFLCDLPYQNLTVDAEYTRQAQAAAMICEKLKRLDHNPPNPGLPEAEYKVAKMGAARSNLGAGFRELAASVDVWMDDSDSRNIERVGHRRWCLNPPMARTGFGKSGVFTAMYSFDQSQKTVPDYDYVAYPPRGLMPTFAFRPKYAWSIFPNPRKFAPPDDKVKAKITPIDEQFRKLGEPLALNYHKVDKTPVGMVPYGIIFRPEKIDMADGQRYLVEIEGLKLRTGRSAGTVAYPVVFIELK